MDLNYSEMMANQDSTIFNSSQLEIEEEMIAQSHLSTGITKPHPHDVLAGRGNNINNHPGNQYFRILVKHLKNEYVVTPKSDKPFFAKLILKQIRSLDPPGRFLKRNKEFWEDIGQRKALDKTRQALREDADKVQKEIDQGIRQVTTNLRKSFNTVFDLPNSLLNQATTATTTVLNLDGTMKQKKEQNSLPSSMIDSNNKNIDDNPDDNLGYGMISCNADTTFDEPQNLEPMPLLSMTSNQHESITSITGLKDIILSLKDLDDVENIDYAPTSTAIRGQQLPFKTSPNTDNQELEEFPGGDNENDDKYVEDFPSSFYDLESNRMSLTDSFRGISVTNSDRWTRNSGQISFKNAELCDKKLLRSSCIIVSSFLAKLDENVDGIDFDDDTDDINNSRQEADICDKHKRKFSTVESIRLSLASSLNFDDIFTHDPKRLEMQKSNFVSLKLRQSLFHNFASEDLNRKCESFMLPDLFQSQHDKRRSSIVESSRDLLKKLVGPNENINEISDEDMKEVLYDSLSEISTEALMTSVLLVGSSQ